MATKCDYYMIKMGHCKIKFLCDLLAIATLSLQLHKTRINMSRILTHLCKNIFPLNKRIIISSGLFKTTQNHVFMTSSGHNLLFT